MASDNPLYPKIAQAFQQPGQMRNLTGQALPQAPKTDPWATLRQPFKPVMHEVGRPYWTNPSAGVQEAGVNGDPYTLADPGDGTQPAGYGEGVKGFDWSGSALAPFQSKYNPQRWEADGSVTVGLQQPGGSKYDTALGRFAPRADGTYSLQGDPVLQKQRSSLSEGLEFYGKGAALLAAMYAGGTGLEALLGNTALGSAGATAAFDPIGAYLTTGGVEGSIAGGLGGAAGAVGEGAAYLAGLPGAETFPVTPQTPDIATRLAEALPPADPGFSAAEMAIPPASPSSMPWADPGFSGAEMAVPPSAAPATPWVDPGFSAAEMAGIPPAAPSSFLDGLKTFTKANPLVSSLAATGIAGALNKSPDAPALPGAGGTGTGGTAVNDQAEANKQAALLQAALNRINTVGPLGSTKYSSEANPNTPGGFDYTQTTSLSPGQQKIFDANQASQLGQSELLGGMTQRLGDTLGKSADFSGLPGTVSSAGDPESFYQKAADAMYSQQTRYLDPQMQREQQALEARLSEQGFVPGTPAYAQAMAVLGETKNKAYGSARDSSILQGVTAGQNLFANRLSNANLNNNSSQIALEQFLKKRAQPLNELNALRDGTQVNIPTAPTTPQVSVAAPDIQGANQQAYQNQLGQYNANVSSRNSTNQALGSLATALGMYYSDERLKEDIVPIGEYAGVNLYRYRIFGREEIGVMAHEVMKSHPNAVYTDPHSGYKMVDYAKVFEYVN